MSLRIVPGGDVKAALGRVRDGVDLAAVTVGIGEPGVLAVGGRVPGLRSFPAMTGPAGVVVPSTQQALWIMLRAADRGRLFDLGERVTALVGPDLELADAMETFVYAEGRDLTGYVDGTENPKDTAAVEAAFVKGGAPLAGSSFVAVQRWQHDLLRFRAMSGERRDATMGRRISDNEEIEDAPPSAHVKRAAQEDYDPPAFMVRRSMPWLSEGRQGLEFIAYGADLDRYERVLRRMVGLGDGTTDGLFSFSRPLTGGYYWCPPVADGKLDLRAIGP
jgi:putative iron-dependent peroxidase